MGKRHQGRELALKVLFELDTDPAKDVSETVAWHASEAAVEGDVAMFAEQLVRGVNAHRDEINDVIRDASKNWELDQMAKVDRVILQIAVYEVTHGTGVPLKAAINESIELAKTFSGDDSGRFVNGVLGKVVAGLGASPEAADLPSS